MGVRVNVTGSRRDMAAVGPNPGRTPTNVPKRTPRKQNKRFSGSKEIRNAIAR